MEISLPKDLQQFVARKVRDGGYADAGEVVREALRDHLLRGQKITFGRTIPPIFRSRAQSPHTIECQCMTLLPIYPRL